MLPNLTTLLNDKIMPSVTLDDMGAVMHDGFVFLLFFGSVALVSLICFYVLRFVLARLMPRSGRKDSHALLHAAIKNGVFTRALYLVPGLIFYISIPLIDLTQLESVDFLVDILKTLTVIYMIAVGSSVASSFLNSIETRYRHFKIAQNYSIKSYIQVGKIILFSLTAILIVSNMLNKSPMYFLTGLGAMTAVLLLVFKDSILGFVASIQLTAYDMVRMGDWIEMPNYGADGTVIDVSLNTIKIQNFDKTIVTIPSYALLSSGVKNWRGMSESGGRRIKRSILIDISSIKFCDSAMLERLTTIPIFKDGFSSIIPEWNDNNKSIATLLKADDRCITNLSIFRMYIEEFLRHHPKIHNEMTFLVRELESVGRGLPVELYIFSSDNDWVRYEKIQADLFDYVYGILPLFDLKVFQFLTGSAVQGASSCPD